MKSFQNQKLSTQRPRFWDKRFICPITEEYREWINKHAYEKRQEEILQGKIPRKSHPPVKNYISALDLLLDYEYDSQKTLRFSDVTQDFISSLIEYCFLPRRKDNGHVYLTKGQMSNKTVNKRIDAIFCFLESAYKGAMKLPRPKHLDTIRKKVIRLTTDELRQLRTLEIDDPILIRTRDYFLFLCYTGLRFGDFAKLDRTYYDEETNEIVLMTQKTSRDCRIHLNLEALRIAEKYDFCFNPVYNQDLNRYIKILLKKYHLFETEVVEDYMCGERCTRKALKRELISCHTGRRTYISILAENGFSAYEIMSATGHTRVETVMFYIDLFGKKRKEKYEALDQLFE